MSGITLKISVKKVPDLENRSEIIRKLADFLLRRVRFFTPVKTGRLKRGWRLSRSGNEIKLTNKVPYASYLNSGQTKARDSEKGLMIQRSLKDAVKYAENRYGVDLNKIVDISYFTIK